MTSETPSIPPQLKLVSVAEMVEMEKASDASGLSYAQMMEEAGEAVAQTIADELPFADGTHVLLLIGPGNNGGDGLVAARHLDEMGYTVQLYLWKRKTDPANDSEGHFGRLAELGVDRIQMSDDENGEILDGWLNEADVVVDALLGTGANRPIEGALAKLLDQVNGVQRERLEVEDGFLTVAVDTPSGVNCDTGAVDPHTLEVDMTVTFGFAKQGLFLFPGAEKVGNLVVADIGIDPALCESQTFALSTDYIAGLLPDRPIKSHKGTFGKALVIAGSVNYPGAAYLSTAAAGRSGAGLVTGAVPQPVWPSVSARLAEATWLLLSHDMGVLNEKAVDVVNKDLANYSALLLGPGLSQEESTGSFVKRLLMREQQEVKSVLATSFMARMAKKVDGVEMLADRAEEQESMIEEKKDEGGSETESTDSDKSAEAPPFGMKRRRGEKKEDAASNVAVLPPTVIDADGLNILAKLDGWADLLPEATILTPHPAEMARLCGLDGPAEIDEPWALAKEKAAEWGAVLLLKGPYTVIAAPDGRLAVLPVATPALATAGTGDVLAGLITGLLAQGMSPFDAACLGAWIHGRAGEIAAYEVGLAGTIASDLLPRIPMVMSELR